MSDERDFAIDAGDLEPAALLPAESDSPAAPSAEPAPVASPKVVIQYRSRGVHRALLPPLLILVTALGITSYQRQAGLRPILRPAGSPKPAEPTTAAGQGRIIMVEAAGTGAAIEPIIVRAAPPALPSSISDPAPALTAEARPATNDPPSNELVGPAETPPESGLASAYDLDAGAGRVPLPTPTEPQRPAGPPLEPPAPLRSAWADPLSPDSPELAFHVPAVGGAAAAAPEPEPKLTKEQILLGIQAEAEQKKLEQKNLEREVAQSKLREAMELIQRTQAERIKFHNELRQILQGQGNDVGAEIKELCDRFGRDMPAEVEKFMTIALKRTAASAKIDVKLALMRWYGAPEPMLLDVLAELLDWQRKTRNGPRTKNDVRVLAAKLLLKYPPSNGPVPRPPGNTATQVYRHAP